MKIGRRTARAMRASRPSQTSGRSKGIRPSPIQKWACRCSRSYKHPRYAELMASLGDRKQKAGR